MIHPAARFVDENNNNNKSASMPQRNWPAVHRLTRQALEEQHSANRGMNSSRVEGSMLGS